MALINLNSFIDDGLENDYLKVMDELVSFFNIGNVSPNVFFVPNRKIIDNLKKKKTESWVVGWVDSGNVYILDRKNFETESNHKYSLERYIALMKHELCHVFFSKLSNGRNKPIWLSEGISIYISGQLKFKKKPEQFTNFLDFGEIGGSGVYKESGFVVGLLVEKYGKEKLFELIRRLSEIKSKEGFDLLFEEIYGFVLGYEKINSIWLS